MLETYYVAINQICIYQNIRGGMKIDHIQVLEVMTMIKGLGCNDGEADQFIFIFNIGFQRRGMLFWITLVAGQSSWMEQNSTNTQGGCNNDKTMMNWLSQ